MSEQGGFRNKAMHKGPGEGHREEKPKGGHGKSVDFRAKRPEGANSRMHGKHEPNGIEEGGSQFGTTIEHSRPARFPNTGHGQKKKGSGSAEIVGDSPCGTTFEHGGSPIEMPDAARRPDAGKVISKTEPDLEPDEHETTGEQTASQKGEGEPTQRKYPLQRQYEKKGKTDKKNHRIY